MTVESKAWNWEIVKGIDEDKWKSSVQEVYYLIVEELFNKES